MKYDLFAASAAVCLAVLAPETARSGPDRISLLLGSQHFSDNDFEELNPGLFLSWQTPRRDLTLGAFRNSYGDLSVLATAGRRLNANWTFFGGIAHYRNADEVFRYRAGKWVPIAGVQFVHKNLFLKFVPGVAGAGLTWPLN